MDGYRYAAKTLARNGIFTGAVVLTLALAISVSSAVVSAAIRAEQSPSVPDATRLRAFYPLTMETGRFGLLSYPEYEQFRDVTTDAITVAAFGVGMQLTAQLDTAVQAGVSPVSGNYFAVLGSQPTLGRLLVASDDVAGADPVVVLTDDAWLAFFGRDPDILGQAIRVGSFPYTVVGVASNPLAGPAYDPDLWVPLSQTAQLVPGDGEDILKGPTARWLSTLGRVRADRDPQQLDAVLAVATEQLQREDDGNAHPQPWRLDAHPVNRVALGPTPHEARARLLIVLTLLTGGFLLAACSNITLLMVTRGTDRAHELAVRSALGATTATLVRLFAWEVVLLVALGGAMAVLALPWIERLVAMPQLAGLVSTGLDRYTVATVSVTAVGVAIVILVFTAVGLEARSRWHGLGLAHGARVTRGTRLRQGLVVVQVTLSCVLLMAAGLLVQSARGVAGRPPGFVPNVLVARVIMPPDQYTPTEGMALYERLRTGLLAQPLVSSVGLAWHAPLSETALSVSVIAPASAIPKRTEITGNLVSPGYFEALGVPVLDGRGFLPSDDPEAPPVVIVNRSFAERWWPTRQTVGRELNLPRSGGARRVVGVVDDIRFRTLTEPVQPLVYLPLTQRYQPWAFVQIRATTVDPMRALTTLRSVVAELDPQIGIGDPRTLADDIQMSLAEWRGPASLAGLLALVTLLLTTVGLYATLATSVSQRTKEMAIRRVLGAQDGQVRRLVIVQGLLPAAVGIVIGVGATTAVMGYLESLLYGVTPRDGITQGAVVGLLGLVAYVSCRGPARRAAGVDPMTVLRAE